MKKATWETFRHAWDSARRKKGEIGGLAGRTILDRMLRQAAADTRDEQINAARDYLLGFFDSHQSITISQAEGDPLTLLAWAVAGTMGVLLDEDFWTGAGRRPPSSVELIEFVQGVFANVYIMGCERAALGSPDRKGGEQ